MLGRLRRTTRLDVGLALPFAGVAYLIWALVAGVARMLVGDMIHLGAGMGVNLSGSSRAVKALFVDAGFVIDLVGLVWLTATVLLVVFASRQKMGISWAWASAVGQSLLAALGGLWVAWAVHRAYVGMLAPPEGYVRPSATEQLSRITLPIAIPLALLVWATALVWLLVERARLNRRRISLRDGLRTNV